MLKICLYRLAKEKRKSFVFDDGWVILQMKINLRPAFNMAAVCLLRSIGIAANWFSKGTDSTSSFNSSLLNPLALPSEEGLLCIPRQGFEIVRQLSKRDTRTTSNQRHDKEKEKLSTFGKMASKTLRNRYQTFHFTL